MRKQIKDKGEMGENEKTEAGRGGGRNQGGRVRRVRKKWVFGSLWAAAASDISHTNPSMAHLQYLAERRKRYQAEDNDSHSAW